MTEESATAVRYGSSSPMGEVRVPGKVNQPEAKTVPTVSAPETKKPNRFTEGVKKAINTWWERVGPASTEKQFVESHARVMAAYDNQQRKDLFEKSAETWRKWGNQWGITATIFDATFAGMGLGFSFIGIKNPNVGADLYKSFVQSNAMKSKLFDFLRKPLSNDDTKTKVSIGRAVSSIPAFAAVGILVGSGPGHALGRLAARITEGKAMLKAKAANYKDSGRAAKAAEKLGKGLGDVAKFTVEHSDQITKSVQTIRQEQRATQAHKQEMARRQAELARKQLEQEYQDWMASMPAGEKAYYVNSNTWPPPIDEFKRVKAAREQAARDAKKGEKRT